MLELINIKKYLTIIFFYLTIIYIGVGSTGAGIQNNKDISYGFLYLFLLMFFFFRKEMISNINKEVLYPILIMMISFFISCFYTEFKNNADVWLRYYAIAACLLFSYLSYIVIVNRIVNIRSVIAVIAALGLFHTIILLNIWFSEEIPAKYNWINGIPFFSNIRHLADYISISFLCALFLFLTAIGKKAKLFWLLISIIILTCVFWTGSRAAYIGIFPSILFLFFLLRKRVSNLIYIVFICVISAVLTLFFQTTQFNVGFFSAFSRSAGNSLNSISSNRVELYKTIFEWFSYHPLWGLGAESVKELGFYQGDNRLTAQAHNSILQILVEFGLMGLIFLSMLLYKIFKKFRYEKTNAIYAICVAVTINIFVASLFNGGAYYVVTISTFCLFVAIAFAYKKLNYEN